MTPKVTSFIFAAVALVAGACHHASTSAGTTSSAAPAMSASTAMALAPNTLTRDEQRAGWKLLFDGTTMNEWRGYKMQTMPAEWMAMNGTLMKSKTTEDIVTRQTFADFEFMMDWKVSLRGNSGLFYRGTEEYDRVYWSAPEYQIAEDSLTPDSRNPLTSAGAVYGFYPSKRGVAKRAGEWNTTRLVVKGAHVEHWLNGTLIAAYEQWSPDFTAKFAASKFKTYEHFARAKSGFIAIQGDHNGELSLRNIKIRKL